MKSIAVISAITLAATVFSVAASAQTGRPSTQEAQEAQDRTAAAQAVAADQEVGSYARYLMLNGATRDEALIEARNVDHPAPRKVAAARSTRTDTTSQQ